MLFCKGKTKYMQELGNTLAKAAKTFVFYEQHTDKVVFTLRACVWYMFLNGNYK